MNASSHQASGETQAENPYQPPQVECQDLSPCDVAATIAGRNKLKQDRRILAWSWVLWGLIAAVMGLRQVEEFDPLAFAMMMFGGCFFVCGCRSYVQVDPWVERGIWLTWLTPVTIAIPNVFSTLTTIPTNGTLLGYWIMSAIPLLMLKRAQRVLAQSQRLIEG